MSETRFMEISASITIKTQNLLKAADHSVVDIQSHTHTPNSLYLDILAEEDNRSDRYSYTQ